MKQNENEAIDRIIDAFSMEKKTGRSRDELHALVWKGMTCLNLAYCLTDVIDWLLFDADATLSPFGAALERKDKQMFGRLKKTACQHAATGPRHNARNIRPRRRKEVPGRERLVV